MASTIITCICFALDDVELLLKFACFRDEIKKYKILRFKLRNLKTFVLSAKKLRNDGIILGSFLVKIEETVRRKAEEIHPFCLDLKDRTTDLHLRMASEFQEDVQSLEEEVEKWYVTILEDHTWQSSCHLTTDEVFEIISSILDNLVDFRSLRSFVPDDVHEILGEAMEALGEHMTFLKSLIHFSTSTQRSTVEPCRKDFLAHTEAVAINAAYLFFMCRVHKFDEEWCRGVKVNVSTLLKKIRPIEAQVYETYTQALRSLKLSLDPSQDMDDEVFIAMKNFLDSLLSNLWEMLRINTCLVISMKDQLQELYEGLRSLRIILKQQPNNFDLKIKAADIGAAVCDAGVLICSLSHTNMQVDHPGLQELLETIKIILAEFGEKDPQVPTFNFPRTNEQGFVDFLLGKLVERASCEVEPTIKSCVQTIEEELLFLRSFLAEIVELRDAQEELQALWDRVLEVAHRVECLIDRLIVGDLPDSFSISFDSIIKDIWNIKADVLKIEVKKETATYSYVPSQKTFSITTEIVGFENEARSIVDRLTRGSKQLQIVAIVGMPGSGKTTLATKVYNDPSILRLFSVHAWCPISQVVDKKRVLLDILNQIDPNKCSKTAEQDLADELRRSLKGRKYLIFLDDIWEIEAWNILTMDGLLFPNDTVGSRIIFTSRHLDAAPHHMLDQEPRFLRQLNKEESMELLQSKLFPKNCWPPALHDIGMQIAENCKGLPLTIVIVAGLLSNREPEGWKEILDSLSSGISIIEHCSNTLELSYKLLPFDLRPCLLYFGAFQEDQEVSVRRLLRLWIAEGFVRKDKMKSLEDVAEDYLKDLIGRSLIMAAKQRSDGGVKACRIHDLLHDFCLQKAKDENFFHFLKGDDELLAFNEPPNLRRLCIHSEPEHFKQSKLFCPHARSLLFNSSQEKQWDNLEGKMLLDISFVLDIFKLLTVLDLEQINLGSVFPSELELLVQLAFLAIRGNMRHIPPSIAKFSSLETFIVDPGKIMLSLPDSLWNLRKLQYLYIRISNGRGGGSLSIENLDNSPTLDELERFSGAIIPCWSGVERLLSKFPKIRKLKCMLLPFGDDTKNLDKIVVPDLLSQLVSLNMFGKFGLSRHNTFEFSLPTNLKKLTLSSFRLPWKKISTIGKLPNLEVLKLLRFAFEGETWEMEEGEFSKLRILKLSALDLVRWRASDDQFLCLQELVLKWCKRLEEMPDCLEYSSTLEMIELYHCSKTAVNLVRHIEREQAGNSCLRIIIR